MFTLTDGTGQMENSIMSHVLKEEIVALGVWHMSLISNIHNSLLVTPARTFIFSVVIKLLFRLNFCNFLSFCFLIS
jgi:hypothetical protein